LAVEVTAMAEGATVALATPCCEADKEDGDRQPWAKRGFTFGSRNREAYGGRKGGTPASGGS